MKQQQHQVKFGADAGKGGATQWKEVTGYTLFLLDLKIKNVFRIVVFARSCADIMGRIVEK